MILTESSQRSFRTSGRRHSRSAIPSRMNKEKFERKQARRAGFKTVEEFRKYVAVIPCGCGKRKCRGWRVKYKLVRQRRREGNA